MRELYALKRETPWKVPADDAYALVAIGGLMPREEHNAILRAVLPRLEERAGPAAGPHPRRATKADSASSRRSI